MPDAGHLLVFTSRFRRELKRFAGKDWHRHRCVKETLERMETNIFDPKLQTHALTGKLAGFHASSCGYDCRIVFHFSRNPATKAEEIILTAVGTHDEVY
jgi:mRNA-degrading endonuclease YafQ of YafQ-DinJ toxin-antitoxin module